AVLRDGSIVGIYHKVLLPNYGVFDEDRYFAAGHAPGAVWEVGDATVGVSICEDVWLSRGPTLAQA
ncbi:MAG: NAD+ synthase, partial [Gemmatimonadetes bacterium]|nr:NAD+ synthase [Gemmatimonadota bacterium]NIR37400.1 NAD+ synthase [Actinomycetota bacterium]NIU75266.1 NAD+ synthase [Gammaproteobacteria bacterium]NIQ55081.1 NAD+ synthase [Gemmatimonadota bacterium]NIV87564.1 NAD+ synthase [Actinomycetota bacterium]